MIKIREIISANSFLLFPHAIILRRSSRALGDNLMLSFIAREIKKANPLIRIGVETAFPELFEKNKNIDRVYTDKVAIKYRKLKYRITKNTRKHILDQIIENSYPKIKDYRRKVEIFLSEKEITEIRKIVPKKYIVTTPTGKKSFAANRKEWGVNKFIDLRNNLSDFDFVQIGGKNDELLPNVIDLRGLPIRKSAAVIHASLTAIFLEGGLMHLANAVNKPSVILYGGAVRKEVSAYEMHTNIAATPDCSPCFTSDKPMEKCKTMICMKKIRVEAVAKEVRKLIRKNYPKQD